MLRRPGGHQITGSMHNTWYSRLFLKVAYVICPSSHFGLPIQVASARDHEDLSQFWMCDFCAIPPPELGGYYKDGILFEQIRYCKQLAYNDCRSDRWWVGGPWGHSKRMHSIGLWEKW